MSYTLAVVDEGLLDLTGFKTPNPWDTSMPARRWG
jgi:alpha-2-macroglobulin